MQSYQSICPEDVIAYNTLHFTKKENITTNCYIIKFIKDGAFLRNQTCQVGAQADKHLLQGKKTDLKASR